MSVCAHACDMCSVVPGEVVCVSQSCCLTCWTAGTW